MKQFKLIQRVFFSIFKSLNYFHFILFACLKIRIDVYVLRNFKKIIKIVSRDMRICKKNGKHHSIYLSHSIN